MWCRNTRREEPFSKETLIVDVLKHSDGKVRP
jgi:hypothetical protein